MQSWELTQGTAGTQLLEYLSISVWNKQVFSSESGLLL